MEEPEEKSMIEQIKLKYDGPLLDEHKMDVTILAPSLHALGQLFSEANRRINGENVRGTVYIKADMNANCITLTLDFQSIITTGALIGVISDPIKILQWLGIINGADPSNIQNFIDLIKFLVLKDNNKIEKTTEIKDSSGSIKMDITITGNNNSFIIDKEVFELSKDKNILKNLSAVVKPVAEIPGIENIEFYKNNQKESAASINKNEAKKILHACETSDEEKEISIITGHIIIHSAKFDMNSKKWTFIYDDHLIHVDISETDIAKKILERRKIVVGDTFKVKMEIKEEKTKDGKYKSSYKVIEVLDFLPGMEQGDLNLFN